jgi:hypothetical protein
MSVSLALWSALAVLFAAGAVALARPTPAYAHHGTVQYDFGGDLMLDGVVADYSFASPHIWLKLRAPGADGKTAEWSLEGPPPQYAVNRGWARDSLKPGQRITVAVARHKDKPNAGLIISVAEPGGKVMLERGRRY